MIYLWATILVLLNAVWWCLNFLGVPGNWLMLAGTALLTWWQWDSQKSAWDQIFGVHTLAIILAVAILGEVLELLTGTAGSKIAGGSWWGALGALLGSVLGMVVGTFVIPVPLVGSLIGACVGAFAGAWGLEMLSGRRAKMSLKSGAAAGTGRLLGTVIKLALGAVIWAIIAVAAYWP